MFGPSWTDPGSDPGGFVVRPDGTIGPARSGDYNADGSRKGSVGGSGEDRSLSGMLGNAASSAVTGQVQDLLSIFNIPDNPSALAAYHEYDRVTEERRQQWESAKKNRQDLEDSQRDDLASTSTISPSNPTEQELAQDAQITYDPSQGAGQWDPYMLRVLDMLGSPNGLLDKFREQVQIESGGNPLAVNEQGGDNPSGLLQVKPGTFDAFKSPDLAADVFDPLANLFAGANYAENDPKYAGRGIAGIWPTAAGYADGGPIRGAGGGRSDLVPLWGSNGEFMVTAPDYSRNKWAVDAIHAGATLQPAMAGGGEGPQVTYNIQAGNTERAFNEAARREKQRQAIGLGRF